MNQAIQINDRAPDFSLMDSHGQQRQLNEFLGKQAVVLYFYPKDETPGCTAQACGFRDHYEDFKTLGAEVIGISGDTSAAHQRFAGNHQLPFVLLSDPENKVRKLYGVPKTLGLLPGRVTYVIDQQGIVRHIFNSQLQATKHISEALHTLQQLV